MIQYGGIKIILDLEACLDFSGAGQNRKNALYEAATETRVVIPLPVFEQVKEFDRSLADEFKQTKIEIVDYDDRVFRATEDLGNLISATAGGLSKAAIEKIPILSMVYCAQNGTLPKCVLVTGDSGKHGSSMLVLASKLKITAKAVGDMF